VPDTLTATRPAVSAAPPATTPWLVCRIDPRRHKTFVDDCYASRIEAWTPTQLQTTRLHRPRDGRHIHEETVPAYPGYVFVHELGVCPALYKARGWRRFVVAGGKPVGVSDRVIGQLRHQEAKWHAEAERKAYVAEQPFKAGEAIELREGWIVGRGFVERDQSGRASVCVRIESCAWAIEVHPSIVVRLAS
jgi:hypothetical protein